METTSEKRTMVEWHISFFGFLLAIPSIIFF
jgi:hypothetical protein